MTNTELNAEGLLPCPFCGAAAVSGEIPHCGSEHNYAGCNDQDCLGYHAAFDFKTVASAIAAWNRRASPIEAPGQDMVMVPRSAIEWLMGEAPDADGKWFSEVEDATPRTMSLGTRRPLYWWRSHFRKLIAIKGAPNASK